MAPLSSGAYSKLKHETSMKQAANKTAAGDRTRHNHCYENLESYEKGGTRK
jgi:hypothetical protein